MNKDSLMGALALSPLFVLFAVFVAAFWVRSHYNRAHPEAERTPAQRLRGKIIGWTMYGLVMAGCAYLVLRGDKFAPSWTIVVYVGLTGFVVGEAFGRRNASRTTEGKPAHKETVFFF